VKEDQWGDLECLYKACQAAITDGGLFTDTGVDERCENERQSENDCEMELLNNTIISLLDHLQIGEDSIKINASCVHYSRVSSIPARSYKYCSLQIVDQRKSTQTNVHSYHIEIKS